MNIQKMFFIFALVLLIIITCRMSTRKNDTTTHTTSVVANASNFQLAHSKSDFRGDLVYFRLYALNRITNNGCSTKTMVRIGGVSDTRPAPSLKGDDRQLIPEMVKGKHLTMGAMSFRGGSPITCMRLIKYPKQSV